VDDFELHRGHLQSVAYRMLGSRGDAEDAVQEAWLRLSRVDPDGIANPRAWLTTVVARICLDMLRSRRVRQAVPVDERLPAEAPDPEERAVLADSVGLALLVVLDTLSPAERLAFVLHDLFDMPFREIAPIVDRTPEAARMLASRARRRVRGADPPGADPARQRRVVQAFVAASRDGDFAALLRVLDPEVVVRADAAAAPPGTPREVRGAYAVAGQALVFAHRAQHARIGWLDGEPAILVVPEERAVLAMLATIGDDRIRAIEVVADPARLAGIVAGWEEDPVR
jgi:RNA polymerase sigma factor (sigma-70 family)